MPSYLIFHPDRARQKLKVTAEVAPFTFDLVGKSEAEVIVDRSGEGNEDPWCITQPWMYSYCHATQLRRSEMKAGDILFFISGERADEGVLCCDTVFVIEDVLPWQGYSHMHRWHPTGLPLRLERHQGEKSREWERHLKFGILDGVKEHSGKFTFIAKPYRRGKSGHSFLPMGASGENVSIAFDDLSASLRMRMIEKRNGKYPVILEADEAKGLYDRLNKEATGRVVNILESPEPNKSLKIKCGCY